MRPNSPEALEAQFHTHLHSWVDTKRPVQHGWPFPFPGPGPEGYEMRYIDDLEPDDLTDYARKEIGEVPEGHRLMAFDHIGFLSGRAGIWLLCGNQIVGQWTATIS